MRHRLRVLLVGSVVALTVSVVTMAAYALASGSSGAPSTRTVAQASAEPARHIQVSSRMQTGTMSGPLNDSEVCGMVTAGEAYRLLNYWVAIGPTPAPIVNGGACDWGTGKGETFELKVVPRAAGEGRQPCAGIDGTEVRADGWVGCSRLSFGNDDVLRAFKGSYVVSIEPEVNVIGNPYLMAEESTVTHVFSELGA